MTLDMKDYCAEGLKASIEAWREEELKRQEADKLAKRAKNLAGEGSDAAKADLPPPPPLLRTNRTRRVLHPVLIGHVASFPPY